MSDVNDDQPLFIGHFWDGDKWDFLPISSRGLQRSMRANLRVLDSFNLAPRSSALVIACYGDTALSLPLERALSASHQIIHNAEATPFEAGRIESFIRLFNPSTVFGLSAPVLQGLASAKYDLSSLFKGRAIWACDPEAYATLTSYPELKVYHWKMVGPACGIECSDGSGLHVDEEEWLLADENSEILVTSRLNKAPFIRQKTGVKASIDYNPCPCGNPSPKIILHQ